MKLYKQQEKYTVGRDEEVHNIPSRQEENKADNQENYRIHCPE